jgi:hypothetical protein
MSEQRFNITRYDAPASTTTTPTLWTPTWDELTAALTQHARRLDKDGAGWFPGRLKPGTTRANENVLDLSLAAADLDHSTMDQLNATTERVAARGLGAIFHTTFRNAPPDDVRFRVVIPFTTPVPADRWPDVWARMNQYLFGGLADAQTKDPSRFFYLPAARPGAPVFTRVIRGAPLDPDTLPPLRTVQRRVPRGPRRGGAAALAREKLFPPAQIEPILRCCAWMRHCRDDARTLSEPEWYAMLSILVRCVDGQALAHEFSAPYPRYSRAETDAKIRHARISTGPRTCRNIRESLGGGSYCRGCLAREFVATPLSIGRCSTPSPARPHAGGSVRTLHRRIEVACG